MSSQPPAVAAAMPVATASGSASGSASASASASSTSPQPSSSLHSSSSSDTVTCAPSAFSPSPGTASARDSHHHAKVLERLVLNGTLYSHTHTRTLKKFYMSRRASTCLYTLNFSETNDNTSIAIATQDIIRQNVLRFPASRIPNPKTLLSQSRVCVISSHLPLHPYTVPFSFSVFQPPFVANSLYRRLA